MNIDLTTTQAKKWNISSMQNPSFPSYYSILPSIQK
jgi:hypothetical protein